MASPSPRAAAYAAGRARFGDLGFDEETFDAFVAAGAIGDDALTAYGEDLFLAAGCLRGHPAALVAFEAEHISAVPSFVSRLNLPADAVDELRQSVRIRMLAGEDPKLRLYTGQGPLGAWVRVVSIRTALNMIAARKPDETARDAHALEALAESEPNTELQRIREQYRARVQTAFERGFEALSAREKTILRMNVIDGQSIDVIGSVYRAHRATVARWLLAIRRRLVDEVRRELALDLRSTSTEAHSLIQLFRNELHVSVARLLAPPQSKP